MKNSSLNTFQQTFMYHFKRMMQWPIHRALLYYTVVTITDYYWYKLLQYTYFFELLNDAQKPFFENCS
jgi:hypothetical protein